MENVNQRLRMILLMALFIALSAVGSLIKPFLFIPLGSSIAFDSAPALVAGALLGGLPGAVVGLLGHIFSAWLGGFPLGIFPGHAIVAVEMFLTIWIFSLLYRKVNKILAFAVFVVLNGVVALLPFGFMIGWPMVFGMMIPISLAALANALVAAAVIPLVKMAIKNRKKTL